MLDDDEEEEVYYGVTIPFTDKKRALVSAEKVRREFGYGCWVRVGTFNGND